MKKEEQKLKAEQKEKRKEKRLELLSPAGSPAAYIAAVENGADAVYLGGRRFNARINADNFSDKELEEAINYGHLRGVKSYVAVNTLLTDDQLSAGLEYAKFLYQIGADGVILQDLGLGYILKQALPELPLHLSTQGSVYDLRGVEAAAALGYERVVLARELPLKDIKKIAAQTDLEIEVFVHGALCFSYSGQCQLSRFIGGRSGNQGCCAQPCRLPYQYLDLQGKLASAEQAHPLSPKDLCLIEELGALAEAQVRSFKIEGRMKSPQYVAVVTSIYRKYLDLLQANGSYTVSQEDWNALYQIFNRGGFTKGYFYQDPQEALLCPGLPKHQGVKIGEVTHRQKSGSGRPKANDRREKGRGKREVWLADIKMLPKAEPLKLGDGIEIHGSSLTGNVITYLKTLGGDIFRAGDLRQAPEVGAPVYKITSRSLTEQAEKTFKDLSFSAGKYKRHAEIKAVFHGRKDAAAILEIVEPLHLLVKEESAAGQLPLKRPTGAEEIKKQLAKTGGTPFCMTEIAVEMEEPLSIPLAGINALRRKALEQLEELLRKKYKRPLPFSAENLEKEDWRQESQRPQNEIGHEEGQRAGQKEEIERIERQFFYYDYDSFVQGAEKRQGNWNTVCLIHAEDFAAHFTSICRQEEEERMQVCPYVPAVLQGREGWLEENFQSLVQLLQKEDYQGRKRRIFVGNINWIQPFAEKQVLVAGNPELNICNKAAFLACQKLGLSEGLPSLEDGSGLSGWAPLMVTEHKMTPGWLVDRKGQKFFLYYSQRDHKSYVLGENDSRFLPQDELVRKKEKLCLATKKVIRIYVKPKVW